MPPKRRSRTRHRRKDPLSIYWTGLISHGRRGKNDDDARKKAFDWLERECHPNDTTGYANLVKLMAHRPEMAGFLFHEYGIRGMDFLDPALVLHGPADVVRWHQDRYRYLRARAVRLERADRRGAPDYYLDQAVVRELELEIPVLEQQARDVVMNQASVPYGEREIIKLTREEEEWNRTYREEIVTGLEDGLARQKARLESTRQRLPAKMPTYPAIPAPAAGWSSTISKRIQEDNVRQFHYPIEDLIEGKHIQALKMLKRLGLFNPHGYTRKGETFLYYALRHNALSIGKSLLPSYSGAEIRGPVRVAGLEPAADDRDGQDHLQLALKEKWSLFFDMWNASHDAQEPRQLRTYLDQAQLKGLCTWATGTFARQLVARGDINLAFVLPRNSPNRDNAWHSAVENPNLDFLDFLAEHIGHYINHQSKKPHQSETETPLDRALAASKYDVAERLIQHGHSFQRKASGVLEELCDPEDPRLVLYLKGMGQGLGGSRWLHEVVEALERKVQQEPTARDVWVFKAKRLIRRIRDGNWVSIVNLNTQDGNNHTAFALSTHYGFPELEDLLKPPANPPASTGARLNRTRYDWRPAPKRRQLN
ncbi:hypothetical protein BJX61DRAFT_48399 [Aspergillus egyptiacus]|nr:hypothetical protein BJX61DRAFT_48399 [Aspergillus egyptiacus]